MGISGHILGPRKLRKLNREVGIEFDRAYNRNGFGHGRLIAEDGTCQHYGINFHTMEVARNTEPDHWSSCREEGRVP